MVGCVLSQLAKNVELRGFYPLRKGQSTHRLQKRVDYSGVQCKKCDKVIFKKKNFVLKQLGHFLHFTSLHFTIICTSIGSCR